MKNNKRIIYGLILCITAFSIALFLGKEFRLSDGFFPNSFTTHSLMLLLSVVLIYVFRKHINYSISLPPLKKTLRPIFLGLSVTIIVNILLSIIIKLMGKNIEAHPVLTSLSPFQAFVFVFIYASIAEELLFRGFLLNMLKPINTKGIRIFKRKLSIAVITSALVFGLSHLILISSGVGVYFLLRIVIFTSILGLIAGYYQEKHNNNAYAIIVHMAGNSMGVLGVWLLN